MVINNTFILQYGKSAPLATNTVKASYNTVYLPVSYTNTNYIVIVTSALGERWNAVGYREGIVGRTVSDFGLVYRHSDDSYDIPWFFITIGF